MSAVQCAMPIRRVLDRARATRTLRAVFAAACAAVAFAPGTVLAQNPAPAQGQPSTEKFVLSGVVVVEGGRGLAWIQEPTLTGNQVVPLRPGERLGPYQLIRVLDDRVELEGPAGTVLVPVYGAAASPGTAAPAVAATVRETPDPAPVRPARVEADPNAMSRREIREAADRLRESRQQLRGNSGWKPDTAPQQGTASASSDDRHKGRLGAGLGRKGPKGAENNSSSMSDTPSSTGGGSSMTISRGDPRRSGFQNMTRSGALGNN